MKTVVTRLLVSSNYNPDVSSKINMTHRVVASEEEARQIAEDEGPNDENYGYDDLEEEFESENALPADILLTVYSDGSTEMIEL